LVARLHHAYTTHHSYTIHTPLFTHHSHHSYTIHTPFIHHSYTIHTPFTHHARTIHPNPIIHYWILLLIENPLSYVNKSFPISVTRLFAKWTVMAPVHPSAYNPPPYSALFWYNYIKSKITNNYEQILFL
jgi:hypothetical protein